MTRTPTAVTIAVALLLVSMPAESHHSYARYEGRPVELEGVVESLDWANPHAILRIRGTGPAVVVDSWAMSTTEPGAAALYLDLMKKCLLDVIHGQTEFVPVPGRGAIRRGVVAVLARRGVRLVREVPVAESRVEGTDWPARAQTMIGLKRLENLQHCVEDVLRRGVPGDLIETGVWRGGATIFMRAILKAHGVTDRRVWVADSFQGLPKPDAEQYPADRDDLFWTFDALSVSEAEVRQNFAHYGLLDDQVRFLVGWFRDTLPKAPIEQVAVARLDGDMYESTMDGLRSLYPKLSRGGYLIVDDYGAVEGCKKAVHDYRDERGITDPIEKIDWTGVFWRRS